MNRRRRRKNSGRSKKKKWTEEEIEYLRTYYGRIRAETIAEKLDRTVAAVMARAGKLGITQKDNQEWMTVSDFCNATNIHRSSVDYWITENGFPASKRSKYRRVYPDKFWKWAKENKHRIQWGEFPLHALGDEPKWVETARKAAAKKMNKRRLWSQWELNELAFLLKQEKYTYPELSERLNRSQGALKRKIYELNLPWPLYVDRQKAPKYTDEEVHTAVELYRKGYPLAEVAKMLNRTEMGLRGKLERSGYRITGKRIEEVER